MNRGAIYAALSVLVGLVAVISDDAYRERQQERAIWEDREGEYVADAGQRHFDLGVELRIVEQDPNGREPLVGKPPIRIVDTIRLGFLYDSVEKTKAASRDPLVWYASPEQAAIILHRDRTRPAQLVEGSEGSGKTTALAMWHYAQWLRHFGEGREGLQTAPTNVRLGHVRREIRGLWRPEWYRYVSRKDFTGYELCDGSSIRMVSTHQQSEADGSPVQGFNSSWAGADEKQDQIEAHADIEARGRSAREGVYPRLATSTMKDSSEYRSLRDLLDTSGVWTRRRLLGLNSPFVWASYWEQLKSTMTAREYDRRVRAMDLLPESATYAEWSRETGLIVVPDMGWTDVTGYELKAMSGPNLAMLVGHDPGNTVDVSLLGKAYVRNQDFVSYQRGIAKPFWVIRGEVNTEQSTTEAHIAALLEVVQGDPWRMNLLVAKVIRGQRVHVPPIATDPVPQILVRADPAGNSDNRTDKTVYTQFANAGIRIKPAAYNAANDGHGRVPREAGVELVKTLLCNAEGERRLFVERLPNGTPAAPMLVKALETSQRDEKGRAEVSPDKGGPKDLTHWPAALRYMLWAIERPRLKLSAREDVT